ncbi:hypothetical protein [Aestuariispira insulae]|uniref:Uncharacterized protein n=1 Tax=Aestuariispira insulae TaxID=1461337 RepID=A0A3D9HRP9_9PROT|nr:hypothetical protein [Aestuariispira insulae]RED52075.1 hypothetical protein DFP90_10293 [Aestuariispira insulae]
MAFRAVLENSASFSRGCAVLLMSCLPFSTALAEICVKQTELPALQTRLFQTELMVAALTCKERAGYNKIISKFKDEFVDQGKELKRTFNRIHGKNAEKRLNRFITRLANEASMRSLRNADYCDNATSLISQTIALPEGELSDFAAAHPFSQQHGVAVCGTELLISQSN